MVDFGSEWCVQECPVLQTTHRGDLPPRAVRLSVVRNAMVVVMAVQLALHSLFWVRERNSESGNDEPVAFMFDVLWGMWAEDKHRWHMARRVFCSDKMEPICSTYYKKDGADMFDVLEGVFSGCKNTHDGQLVSVGGATWKPRHPPPRRRTPRNATTPCRWSATNNAYHKLRASTNYALAQTTR